MPPNRGDILGREGDRKGFGRYSDDVFFDVGVRSMREGVDSSCMKGFPESAS